MKRLSVILITILLLFSVQVSAEYYDFIIITNPNGAPAEYIPKSDDDPQAMIKYVTLPVGTKLTNVNTESRQRDIGGVVIDEGDFASGYTIEGNQYEVKQEDTSLKNIYPPVDEEQINIANTPKEDKDILLWPWIILAIIVVIGFVILSAYLNQPQCPKCKSRGSREVKRQFLNSERVLFKEEERIKEYDNKGRSRTNTMHKAASNQYVNPPKKIIVREKLVEGTREYYKVTYQCNKCGEQYTRKEYVDRKPKIV